MSLDSYLRAAPKAELHVHLEGTVQPETLLELARRNNVSLPYDSVPELREWFRFRDFMHFIEVYGTISRCLTTSDDFELIAWELAQTLARQNCRYAEVCFSSFFHARRGIAEATFMDGLRRARSRARTELGVEIAWVFDIGRGMRGGWEESRRWADYAVNLAIETMAEGVVALGLGGPEAGNPPEPFAPYFERALAAGLHSYPHAGEHDGPSSVRGALDVLHAERIAHGVRAIEDPALVAEIARRGIAVDVCPTSNICLGVFPSLAEHALPTLRAAGVPVTIGSDDPPLFNTTLNDDIALLADPFGLDVAACDEILLNGVRHSFLPESEKRALEMAFRTELDALKAVHLRPAETPG
jgi:aminodeoxyfutalosine deaminase